MQSSPLEASNQFIPATTSEDSSQRHHGLNRHYARSPSPSRLADHGDAQRLPNGPLECGWSSSGSTTSLEALSKGLRPELPPKTRASIDRISEYERALTPSPRRNDSGPGFKVIQKAKKAAVPGTSTIVDFPNGRSLDFSSIKTFAK